MASLMEEGKPKVIIGKVPGTDNNDAFPGIEI
jgi:hypothetical protein